MNDLIGQYIYIYIYIYIDISYARKVRRIKQQICFNHRCKDLGLVPAGLRIKSPKEAICIVKATCRRLIRARINDCHRRLNYSNDKLLLCLSKLKELLYTSPLDTVTTITNELTRLQNNSTYARYSTIQTDSTSTCRTQETPQDRQNWVRNISSRPLGENEMHVLSYTLKHSITTKHISTDNIVSSVESVLVRQRELPESTKDDLGAE